jgi:site-specific DNA-methyltransferase (adenine-specific)
MNVPMVARHRPWRIIRPPSIRRMVSSSSATLLCGDSRMLVKTLAANSIDCVVTDPPYALESVVKRFGNPNYQPAKGNQAFVRASRGFMGQTWDTGDAAHDAAFWREIWRVLKPGAFVLAFGGTRTYHRLACAIEDAGFEIRDMVQWLYGSGFPKSHNQGDGRGTALKPACEPICMARKPLSEDTVAANVLRWGTGAINIDGCRVVADDKPLQWEHGRSMGYHGAEDRGPCAALTQEKGRWPANVITDGSDEVVAMFPQSKSGTLTPDMNVKATTGWSGGSQADRVKNVFHANEGSAARFFYQAKATKQDRAGSKHPTVKPVSLMRYLCRLVTPPGGIVLDPFAGTGTTGEAAHLEGFKVIMIEREARFADDVRSRYAALKVELVDGANRQGMDREDR